jgi:hypothetical protein
MIWSPGYLEAALERLRSRVRAAVESRRVGDPEPDDPFRGLHVSPAQVQRLLQDRPAPESPAPSEQPGEDQLAFGSLAEAFGLDQTDLEILLVALAPDLEPRFEPLYGYLHDDVSRRRASPGLALELCGLSTLDGQARSRFGPESRLVRMRLLLVEEPERPFLTRALRVPDRVTAHLLGDFTPDPLVAELLAPAMTRAEVPDPALSAWLRSGHGLAYIRERPGSAAAPLAAAAAHSARTGLLPLDLERVRADEDLAGLALLAQREARLMGAILLAGPVESLAGRGSTAVRAFSELAVPVILSGLGHWDPAWSRQVPFMCEAAPTDAAARASLWRASLDGVIERGLDPGVATTQFRLTPPQVTRAAASARTHAAASGKPADAADLRAAARAQNAAGLERLARRIEPAVGFDDLVLPTAVVEQLRELTVRAHWRERVLDEWRLGGGASRRRGLSVLFAGASGTGKTMAAEVVAGDMSLDLYVVDLATVVDKYVGETEKNLDRIFGEAERVNGVILFDEADALFGKRSDVSDAHDRYANVEVAYLLQRMELFEGIAVLATNLRSNLDEAFARRLDLLVDFPEPEEEDRLRLWERCLGGHVPRDPDLDLGFLAGAFKLSGGNIRNIVVTAAYMAADSGQALSMSDLIRATQREYRKLGRMVVESEFGSYYRLVAEAR